MDYEEIGKKFVDFVKVIKSLRTPETGCPWDLEQDHKSLRPYLIEEAHEVLDAIDNNDQAALADELGDVLLQVVLHSQVAADNGNFDLGDVISHVSEKMIRRHPHVFSDVEVDSSAEVLKNWEQIKLNEQKNQNKEAGPESSHPISDKLASIPSSLPALLHAQRLGDKTSKVNFDWSSIKGVLEKVHEELAELEVEIEKLELDPSGRKPKISKKLQGPLEHELGDLLFSLCQLSRWLELSAEDSLRVCSKRFLARFKKMELLTGGKFSKLNEEQLDEFWRKAKE